ncbi:hypothetical protein F4679DRAFT_557866 [Xylaria curta]|nr:hypothetical protein F4679DRAFT_557866 [Xylaria curta]
MDLDNTPALPPPPNVTPDFSRLSDILPIRYALFAVSISLSSSFVAIRIYVRARIEKIFNLDDCESAKI